MVKITITGNAKIGTFFQAETGGKIIADGVEIIGGNIDRLANATSGASISARDANISGRIGQAAVASTGGTVDLSNATIRNIGIRADQINPNDLAHKLTELLGEEVSIETTSKIIEAFRNAEGVDVVEDRAKKLGIWELVNRIGGVVAIVQAAASLLGLLG